MSTKQWNIWLKFKKGKENAKSMQIYYFNKKDCLFSKKPSRERKQRKRGKAGRAGALIRAGAHIGDNTVPII